MHLVLIIFGILALGFFLNVILKQTYNFFFFLGKKPWLWILIVTVFSGLFWFICAFLGWSVSVPAWAATISLIMNLPPSSNKESKESANEIYSEMGMKNGVLLYRIGLGGFVLAAIASWVIFYGQSCNNAGECSGFFK
jgi:energy-coupling factor transporter transmembrane protein EcfT